jgi:beta-alanine--pyruvate transaminase
MSLDLSHFWMPFTDNRYFKSHPRMLASANGMYYRSYDGHEILDGTAGLWCVNAGHNRRSIVDAIKRQADTLDFAPCFQLGHPAPFDLARRLAKIMPGTLDRIFFTNSGSESVDTALKISLAYHRAKGQGQRTRLIGRERGYHGTNFGGTSVGGIGPNRYAFGVQLPGVDHLAPTYRPSSNFNRGQPDVNEDLAVELEGLIALHGAQSIAALIVEPVACSGGVFVPPRGYLQRLREITERHGIILIFDEVITAFGRLGKATAAEYFGVLPDIITMAKGLTNGTVPMGAVAVRRDIHDTIMGASPAGVELFHGYTYSGHPLASAAGIATLELYEQEALFERAFNLSTVWEDAVHSLRGTSHVADIRNLGIIAGIDLIPRHGAPGQRGADVFRKCFDQGLLIRVSGDFVALSPPLPIETNQIEEIIALLGVALSQVE